MKRMCELLKEATTRELLGELMERDGVEVLARIPMGKAGTFVVDGPAYAVAIRVYTKRSEADE